MAPCIILLKYLNMNYRLKVISKNGQSTYLDLNVEPEIQILNGIYYSYFILHTSESTYLAIGLQV